MAPAGSVRRYSEGAVTARHQSSRPSRSGAESATCAMHALAIDKGNSDDDCDANTSKPSSSPDAKASGVPLKVQLLNYLSVTIIVGLSYALLYLSIGDSFLPTNPAWCLYIIWVCSHLGAILIGMCRLPPLLGMLLSGILLKNLPIDLVEGLPKSWSSGVRAVGLSVILMRSGLELDYEAIKKIGWMAGRLTVLPGTSEAFLAGLVAHGLFGMPVPLAFSLGFILAAVSPAVVVIGMFDLGRRGYGIKKGIPSLVVAAASFDDVIAISGYSIFIGLSLTDGPLYMSLLHGPIEIVSGIASGVLAGLVASATVLWTDRPKRTAVVAVMGLGMMFFGKHFHFQGAGAMAGLVMGIVTGIVWSKGYPGSLSIGANGNYTHEVESDLAHCWHWIAQPLLFGVIGASVDFRKIDTSTIPKCAVVIIAGLFARLPLAFAAVHGKDYTLKEMLFVALSWMPKATVQAALASAPLDMIEDKTFDNPKEQKEYEDWGNVILTTAVLSILITAPIGSIFINKMGPRWLTRDTIPKRSDVGDEAEKGIVSSDSRETLINEGIEEDHSLDMIGIDRDSYPLFKLRDSFKEVGSKDSYSISSLSYRTLLKLSAARDFVVRAGNIMAASSSASASTMPVEPPESRGRGAASARRENQRDGDFHKSDTVKEDAESHASFLKSLLQALSFLKDKRETGRLRSLAKIIQEQDDRHRLASSDDSSLKRRRRSSDRGRNAGGDGNSFNPDGRYHRADSV